MPVELPDLNYGSKRPLVEDLTHYIFIAPHVFRCMKTASFPNYAEYHHVCLLPPQNYLHGALQEADFGCTA